MQMVIDINDKAYGLLKYFEKGLGLNDKKDDSDDVKTALMRAVINGTPLPKGHGRLIDADEIIHLTNEIEAEDREEELYHLFLKTVLTDAPTIIEADRSKEDEL